MLELPKKTPKDEKTSKNQRKILVIAGNFTGDMYGVACAAIHYENTDVLILKEVILAEKNENPGSGFQALLIPDDLCDFFGISEKRTNKSYEITGLTERCKSFEIISLVQYGLAKEAADRRIFILPTLALHKTYSMLTGGACSEADKPGFKSAFNEYVHQNTRNSLRQYLNYELDGVFGEKEFQAISPLFKKVQACTYDISSVKRDNLVQSVRKKWIKFDLQEYKQTFVCAELPTRLSPNFLYISYNPVTEEIRTLPHNFSPIKKGSDGHKNLLEVLRPHLTLASPNKINNIKISQKEEVDKITSSLSPSLSQSIHKLLETKLSPRIKKVDQIFHRRYLVVWVRLSGEQGGAHLELDMGREAVRQIIDIANKNLMSVILSGERGEIKKTGEYTPTDVARRKQKTDTLSEENGVVLDLREIWKDKEFLDLANTHQIPPRVLLFNFFDFLNRTTQGIVHLGMRSGSLEPYAYVGHCATYIEELGNERAVRMASLNPNIIQPKIKPTTKKDNTSPGHPINKSLLKSPGSFSSSSPAAQTKPSEIKQSAKLGLQRLQVDQPSTRKGKYVLHERKKQNSEPKEPKLKTSGSNTPKAKVTKHPPWFGISDHTQRKHTKEASLRSKSFELPQVLVRGFAGNDRMRINHHVRHAKSMNLKLNIHGYSNWHDTEFQSLLSKPLSPSSPSHLDPFFSDDLSGLQQSYMSEDKNSPIEHKKKPFAEHKVKPIDTSNQSEASVLENKNSGKVIIPPDNTPMTPTLTPKIPPSTSSQGGSGWQPGMFGSQVIKESPNPPATPATPGYIPPTPTNNQEVSPNPTRNNLGSNPNAFRYNLGASEIVAPPNSLPTTATSQETTTSPDTSTSVNGGSTPQNSLAK